MHSMTREELRDTKLATDDALPAAPAAVVATPAPSVAQPAPRVTDGARASPISNRRWAIVDRSGTAALARRHPLTVEGEDIGSFDLVLACGGADTASYDVSYVETRHVGEQIPVPPSLSKITMRIGSAALSLKVSSSERRKEPDQLVTYASASLPASVLGSFASAGNRSIVVETETDGMITIIRLGNTGAQSSLPQLADSCRKGIGDRAEMARPKTGNFAAAQ